MTNGLIISAPSSGAGKTMVTLGLLRALRNRGTDISSAKSGPDYIDPAFHHAASGKECVNLDAWAISPTQLQGLAAEQAGELLLIEGAMGLFDAALDRDSPQGKGSVADLSEILNLPVVLVLDASKQAQTAAAIVAGLAGYRDAVNICAVILNKVGSAKHREMLAGPIEALGIPVIGAIPRTSDLTRPSRHLGLVQANEDPDLEGFINRASRLIGKNVDLDALLKCAAPLAPARKSAFLPPLGRRIAIARDAAFAFVYPHLLQGWRDAGAKITFFSPLANQAPDTDTDTVFLPGGYPELYAQQLAANKNFIDGIKKSDAQIYGECGGYMMLGEHLTDAKGQTHKMLGLLPVSTSFAQPKLHLGYRNLQGLAGPFKGKSFKAHEFHFASITSERTTERLFQATDSLGKEIGAIGHVLGKVSGSFAHIIC